MTGILPPRMLALGALMWLPAAGVAAEGPFFVTYTHQMEEPGNLEFATKNVLGKPRGGNRFLGTTAEFEYGVTAWWTSELYLDGQTTGSHDSLFTGFRWENRFRLLPREHWINPVFYFEFANLNGVDRSLLEIVNHDGNDDLRQANADARFEKKREIEASSYSAAILRVGRSPKTLSRKRTSSTHRSNSGMPLALAVHLRWRPDRIAATSAPRIFKSAWSFTVGLGRMRVSVCMKLPTTLRPRQLGRLQMALHSRSRRASA